MVVDVDVVVDEVVVGSSMVVVVSGTDVVVESEVVVGPKGLNVMGATTAGSRDVATTQLLSGRQSTLVPPVDWYDCSTVAGTGPKLPSASVWNEPMATQSPTLPASVMAHSSTSPAWLGAKPAPLTSTSAELGRPSLGVTVSPPALAVSCRYPSTTATATTMATSVRRGFMPRASGPRRQTWPWIPPENSLRPVPRCAQSYRGRPRRGVDGRDGPTPGGRR